jgi:hypothetical protein
MLIGCWYGTCSLSMIWCVTVDVYHVSTSWTYETSIPIFHFLKGKSRDPYFHWTDFNENCSLSIFRKSAEEIRVSLTSVKNNVFFTWRPIYVFLNHVSLSSDRSCRQNQNTHFIFLSPPPLPENRGVCEIMWKNYVQQDRPQINIWRMRIAFWMLKATDSHNI